MKPKSLLVYPAAGKLIVNHEMLARGIFNMVGRVFDKALRGYKMAGQPVAVKNDNYYLRKIKDGDLLAANQETAQYCQVALHTSPAEEVIETNTDNTSHDSGTFTNRK